MRPAALVTGLAVLTAGILLERVDARQQTQPTFRLGVNFVEIDAVVTDDRGQFIRDLQPEDFQLYENGSPQDVSVFSLVDIPVELENRPLYRAAPVASDVLGNDSSDNGRVYFLVLDDLHVDPKRTQFVRQLVQNFINRYLGANDLAAVVHVGQPQYNQAFTYSKPLLRQAAGRFVGRKLPSRTLNKLEDASRQQELADLPGNFMGPLIDPDAPVRLEYASLTLGTLEDLSRYVSRLQGRRKAVVFFSEGIDYDLESPLTDSFSGLAVGTEINTIHGNLRSLLETAMRANVSIYPIDPRGLGHELEGVSRLGAIPSKYSFPEGIDPLPSYGFRDVERGLRDELDGSLDALRTLATETGGFAAINRNEFEAPFRRIVEENSSYYLLGYYPTNRDRNGTFRRVEVQVRQPGLTVRARRGYFAPRSNEAVGATPTTPADALAEVVAAPTASSGLTMRAVPQLLKSPTGTGRVHLTLELPAGELPFVEADGVFNNQLLMTWQIMNADGDVHSAMTREATLKLRPRSHARAAEFGVSMTIEFDLPAGQYQLRLAGIEQVSGRSGSVIGDLDVPRFSSAPLAMSSLVLAVPTPKYEFAMSEGAGALGRLLPAPPTTRREFEADEQLAVYAEIYDNDERPHTVDLALRVIAEDGRQVYLLEDQRDRRELAGRAYGHLVALPLDQFRPGNYVVSMEARSRLGTEIKRETMITVR